MNATPNYQLSQWDASDRVLRTDFNADNAKIEAALSDLEARVALLDRAAPNMAYYLGQLAMHNQMENKKYLNQRCFLSECFLHTQTLTLSGGAVLENNILTVSGSGSTGICTALNRPLGGSKWTQARLWVHYSNAKLAVKINGVEMMPTGLNDFNLTASGEVAEERQFILEGDISGSVQVSLEVTCTSSKPARVYDYFVFFF